MSLCLHSARCNKKKKKKKLISRGPLSEEILGRDVFTTRKKRKEERKIFLVLIGKLFVLNFHLPLNVKQLKVFPGGASQSYLLVSLPSSLGLQMCSCVWQDDLSPGKLLLHLG